MSKSYPKSELYKGDNVALIKDAFIYNSIVDDFAGECPSRESLHNGIFAWFDAYSGHDLDAVTRAVEATVVHSIQIGEKV